MAWFERILERNPAGPRHLVGGRLSYADLSLFQIVEGLRYAFPRAAARMMGDLNQRQIGQAEKLRFGSAQLHENRLAQGYRRLAFLL
jgi:hypothetical protein